MIALAILAGLMCVACVPKNERLLREYEKACQAGDLSALMQVGAKMDEAFGDASMDEVFTKEQQARFEAASLVFEQKTAEKTMEQLGGMMDQMNKLSADPWADDEDDEGDDDE